jgi:hypothetical protein
VQPATELRVVAVKYIDFKVTGDPARAKATAERALTARGFQVNWQDYWSGTAERGNRVANVLAGAFVQYFKVGLALRSAEPGHTIVRIERLSSGWAGGAIGASRTTKNIANLGAELDATFRGAGVLASTTEG